MTIALPCPACNRVLTAPPHFAGRALSCPNCKQPVVVPHAAPMASRPPVAPASPPPPAAAAESEFELPLVGGEYTRHRMANYNTVRLPMIVILAAWVIVCLGVPVLLGEIGNKISGLIELLVALRR